MRKVGHLWLTIPLLDAYCRYYAVSLLKETLFSQSCTAISAAETVGGLLSQKHSLIVFRLEFTSRA